MAPVEKQTSVPTDAIKSFIPFKLRTNSGLSRFLRNSSISQSQKKFSSFQSKESEQLSSSGSTGNPETEDQLEEDCAVDPILAYLGNRSASFKVENQATNRFTNEEIKQIRHGLLPEFQSFAPKTLLKLFAEKSQITPMCESTESVVMLADVSGFTIFSEKLCRQGADGVEELSRMMNSYFGELIHLIDSFGGDIINFAGDALLITWEACNDTLENQAVHACRCGLAISPIMKHNLCMHIGIATGHVNYAVLGGEEDKFQFLMVGEPITHVGLAEGFASKQEVVVCPRTASLVQGKVKLVEVSKCQVGDTKESDPIDSTTELDGHRTLTTMETLSQDDSSMLHREDSNADLYWTDNDDSTVEFIERVSKASSRKGGSMKVSQHRVAESVQVVEEMSKVRPVANTGTGDRIMRRQTGRVPSFKVKEEGDTSSLSENSVGYCKVLEVLEAKSAAVDMFEVELDWDHQLIELVYHLYKFVPKPAANRLVESLAPFANDLRTISTVFMMFDGFGLDLASATASPKQVCAALQLPMETVQKLLRRYQGMLRQFIIDDKGCVAIAGFGVPGFKHQDDAARAVRCALSVNEWSKTQQTKSFIGVSTGQAFCGAVGSYQRREYAMVGKAVNLSARLMVFAKKLAAEEGCDWAVCADTATFQEAKGLPTVEFVNRGKHQIKGFQDKVCVHEAQQRRLHIVGAHFGSSFSRLSTTSFVEAPVNGVQLFGRQTEMEMIDSLMRNHAVGGCLVISGGAGAGKHTMATYALACLQQQCPDAFMVECRATALDGSTPFFVASQFVQTIVGELRSLCTVGGRVAGILDDLYRITLPTSMQLVMDDSCLAEAEKEFYKSLIILSVKHTYKVNLIPSPEHGSHSEENEVQNAFCFDEEDDAFVAENQGTVQMLFFIISTSMSLPYQYHDMFPLPDVHSGTDTSAVDKTKYQGSMTPGVDFAKGTQVHQLIVGCIDYITMVLRVSSQRRFGLFISNSHHMDFASATVVTEVFKRSKDISSIVITTLPDRSKRLAEHLQRDSQGCFHELELKPLDREAISELTSAVMKIPKDQLQGGVIDFVLKHGQGNPYNSIAIASGLANSDISLEFKQATENPKDQQQNLEQKILQQQINSSNGVLEATIIARFDKLAASEQVVLKAAAAIGTQFAVPMLKALLPRELCLHLSIDNVMQDLLEMDWVAVWRNESALMASTFCFPHELVRFVIYELNLPSVQKLLHLAIADYIERVYHMELWQYLHTLMHHHQLASNDMTAFNYGLDALMFSIRNNPMEDTVLTVNRMLMLNINHVELQRLVQVLSDTASQLVLPTRPQFLPRQALKHSSSTKILRDMSRKQSSISENFLSQAERYRHDEDKLLFMLEFVEREVRRRGLMEQGKLPENSDGLKLSNYQRFKGQGLAVVKSSGSCSIQ